MKKIFAFSFLVFFACAGISIAAVAPEELYQKGNASYENNDYERAVSIYEELVSMDRTGPEVFYNLGNSYFKLKKIGKAILNYERALRLDPRDKDTQLNLKLARAMAVDKINTDERGFILNALFFLYDRLSVDELSLVCSALYLLMILVLIFSIFFVAKRRFMVYTAGTFGVIFLTFLIFLFAKINGENSTKTGIVVVEKVDVRSGPKEDYLLQFTLHEGVKASVIKKVQGWYEIGLSRDLRGWVPETSVDII